MQESSAWPQYSRNANSPAMSSGAVWRHPTPEHPKASLELGATLQGLLLSSPHKCVWGQRRTESPRGAVLSRGSCSWSTAWAAWNRVWVYKQPQILCSWWAAKASGAAMPGSLLTLLWGDFLLPLTQILARWTRPCSPLAGLAAAGPKGIQE